MPILNAWSYSPWYIRIEDKLIVKAFFVSSDMSNNLEEGYDFFGVGLPFSRLEIFTK